MAIGVSKRENETLDSLMKRFRRSVQEDGVLQVAKRREFYEKPSEKRQRLIKQSNKKRRQK